MSENAQRVGILIITVTFLVTTVGLAFYAVLFNDDSSTQLSQQEIEQMINEQNQEAQVTPLTCNNDPSLNYTPQPPLEGTQLPNYQPLESIPELTCTDIVVGEGAEVPSGATVTAHYTGAIASTGVIFQSSHDQGQPIPFSLSGVIAGWTQGVPGMKEGGKRRLFIPSALAYGESGTQGIPPSSDLVFDVEIVKLGE